MDGAKVRAFDGWLSGVVLPMWLHRGVSARSGLPVEALDAQGAQLQDDFHRVMAVARQAFFLLRMEQRGSAGCAQRGLQYLDRLNGFTDPKTGTFPYSVDASGAPRDARRDLYTHAFVVFAYAQAYRNTRDGLWLKRANALREAVHRHFLRPGAAAYSSALSADLSAELEGPLQNPHMHLFEAIAWLADASGGDAEKAHLDAVAEMVLRVFGDSSVPAVLELPAGAQGNRIEPGHQAEWFSLACMAGPLLAQPHLPRFAQQAFNVALQSLLDRGNFTFPLSATVAMQPLDATRRIWTQLELVRALALQRGRGEPAPALEPALDALIATYLRPHGWIEAFDGKGAVLRADMPATTPYHLVTCLDALAPTDTN